MRLTPKRIIRRLLQMSGYSFHRVSARPLVTDAQLIDHHIRQAGRLSGRRVEMRTICDVGANEGQTAVVLGSLFPHARIFCFEPVKSTYESLVRNTHGNINIHPFPFALGARKDELTMQLRESNQWNSLATQKPQLEAGDKVEAIRVETLDDVAQEQGLKSIDLLKTDTEGFDLQVLQGAECLLAERRIQFVSSEVGFLDGDLQHTKFSEIHTFLYNYGFRVIGFVGTTEDLPHYAVENRWCLGYCDCLFFNSDYRG